MANIKSAKKRAIQNEKCRIRNVARRSDIKTAVKKVLTSLEKGEEASTIRELMRSAEAKLSRAVGKRVVHRKTASRKISRLAKKVAAATRTEKAAPAKKD